MEENYEKLLGQVRKPRKNSRTKGANNERSLCKTLLKWTGHEFARIPSSGGLRWKEGQNIVGDLVCTNSKVLFPFSIETKHYEKVTCVVKDGWLAPTCTMYKIWMQACRDAERENKIPLCLIKTQNQRGWTVYIPASDFVLLGLGMYLCGTSFKAASRVYSLTDENYHGFANGRFITFPSSLLLAIPFESIIKAYKANYLEEAE